MQLLSASVILCLFIRGATSGSDLVSENSDWLSENNVFSSDSISDATINGAKSLTIGNSNWLLDDNNIGLDSMIGSSSNLFLVEAAGSDSKLPLDTVDWDLQPGLDATLVDFSTDPNSWFQDSIWDQTDSSLAAHPDECEVSLADETELFMKRRRSTETECQEPDQDTNSGETPQENPGSPKGNRPKINPNSPGPWPRPVPDIRQNFHSLNYLFWDDFERCSERIFLQANVPVCKEPKPAPDQYYFQPGQSWMHLYDVSPRELVHDPQKNLFNI